MRIWVGVAVLVLLTAMIVGFTWWALTRPPEPKPDYCRADCRVEKRLKSFANASLERSGSSMRVVSPSCSQKSAHGWYCIALMGGAGGRFCAAFAVFQHGQVFRIDAASRLPYCPGEG